MLTISKKAGSTLPSKILLWHSTLTLLKKQKQCDRKLLDYIDGVMCSESWGGILLPLTSNQRPPAGMLRQVINKSLLPRPSSEC